MITLITFPTSQKVACVCPRITSLSLPTLEESQPSSTLISEVFVDHGKQAAPRFIDDYFRFLWTRSGLFIRDSDVWLTVKTEFNHIQIAVHLFE